MERSSELMFIVLWFFCSVLFVVRGYATANIPTNCEPKISKDSLPVCTSVINCNLTIPCGKDLSNETLKSYNVFSLPSGITTFNVIGFLTLNTTFNYHMARVICRVGSLEMGEYLINVTYPPMLGDLSEQDIPQPIDGLGLVVKCPITGNPAPSITWTRYSDIDEERELLLPEELEFLSLYNSSWRVDSWRKEYNGFYLCCGTNVLGHTCYSDISTFRIFSELCNTAIMETGSIHGPNELDLGASFTIKCEYSASTMDQPPQWYYRRNNHKTLTLIRNLNHGHYNISYSHFSDSCVWTSELYVRNFTFNQVGEYICFHGINNESLTVDVKACYKNSPKNSSLNIAGSNEERFIGSNFSLSCTVEKGNPIALPRWCRVSGSNCNLLAANSTFTEDSCTWFSTLQIYNFSHELEGTYRCFIPNTNLMHEVSVSVSSLLQGGTSMDSTGIAVAVSIGVVALLITVFGMSMIMVHWFRVTSFDKTKEPPYEGFKWDVFISFHHEVEEFADQHIKNPLEKALYEVCWHHNDFLAGQTIIDNINDAVNKSRKVIIVFSKSFPTSDHCMVELSRAMERLQMTRTRCIVPIAVDQSDVPEELRSKVTYWPVIEVDKNFYENLMKAIGPPRSSHEQKG